MAFSFSPKLVTEGLVLALDAANPRSYVSGSTVWNDLSKNVNSGTLTNGPVYSSLGGGSIFFDGTNDFIGSFPILISGQDSKTVCCFFNCGSNTRRGLLGTRAGGGGTGWAFTINRTTAGNLTYYHAGGSQIELAAGIQTNTWYYAIAKYDSVAQTGTLYLNGIMIGSPQTSFSTIPSTTVNGFVGQEQVQGFGLTPFSGSIAAVQIYNRSLSDSEILQNYNALKGRFNLT